MPLHRLPADRRGGARRRGPPAGAALIGRASTLAALQHRQFRLLWIGYLFANTAWWMQMFGLGWLAVELAARDGDIGLAPLYVGLLGLARAAPALTVSLVAGAVVDRAERRRVMIVAQLAGMALTATLGVLVIADAVGIVTVMIFTALVGMTAAFDGPARQSMLPRLVPKRDIMSAVGLQSLAAHGTGIVGAALAGLLIGPIGVGGLLLANAAGHVPIVLIVRLMDPMPPAPDAEPVSVARSIRDGLAFVANDPVVRWVFVVGLSSSLLARPYLNLLPAYVATHLHLGAGSLSLLLSITGVGALLGALVVASVSGLSRRGLLFLSAGISVGVLVALLGLQRDIVGAAVACFAAGFAVLLLMGVLNTILQTATPERFLGRVMSVQMTMWMGLMPLGQLVMGAAGTVAGLDRVFVAGGLAAAAVAIVAFRRADALRDLAPDGDSAVAPPDALLSKEPGPI